ncbi:MAG: bifunctional [glutamate--ammonia ligase]-adenylyl-L-tyrosine phosphorylase/[glutamate--ammonia-ligase] adenylyltransferase [Nitrospinae bacterium]|nr:bifunctional [glutamate--ammonia ligase]-adenylyl-L-tyrosine phosphorylase/[glutamate--ammonia-ligase] adenylyltransferase [Nitrospinota bacterium]
MNKSADICQWIYQNRPWDALVETSLGESGFSEPQNAWRNLTALAGQANFQELFPAFFPAALELLAGSFNPDVALSNFERFAEKLYDKNYFYTILHGSPELLKALIALFSGSQFLSDALINDPSYFDWLKQPETLSKPKSKDLLYRDFHEMAGDRYLGDETPRLLRLFKKREYIRVGLRDLLGLAEFKETAEDISNIADVCLQIAYEFADRRLKKKHGVPFYQCADGAWKESEFAILGMGKLGGRELNFSSDIDLIYIYSSSMGETRPDPSAPDCVKITNHEYSTKLAQTVTRTINEIDRDGNVFRVDLNLRPEGHGGEIANSLASSEIYYQSWGRTWERQALIKARVSAGSEALGNEFFAMIEPFIYRKHLDFAAVDEIKSMKDKIDQDLRRKKAEKGNIKLGFGGIREVEFTVQSYQLLFGGRDKRLRGRNTLDMLDRLREGGFVPDSDRQRLRDAYIFLRNLENRVQISFGLQTHRLPRDPANLAILARKMGLSGRNPQDLIARLFEEYEKHTQFVGALFAGLFAESKKEEAREIAFQEEKKKSAFDESQFAIEALKDIPFSDPQRAFQFLQSLRDGPEFSHPTEKSVQNFYLVLPKILARCRETPKPNSAVENLVRFVEASRARETYLDILKDNDKFLELLLVLFGGSDYLSEILVKQPAFTDVLLNLESIYRFKPQEKILEELRRSPGLRGNLQAKKILLRRFKQGEELRIGMRYLIQEADLRGTLSDLSNLADAFLQIAFALACEETANQSKLAQPPPCDFAVIGMGKLGGRELNFGSDLDMVFVYDEPAGGSRGMSSEDALAHYISLSQTLVQLTSEVTTAGYAYKIDTDLRPDGSKGLLVLSLQGYEDYFNNRARTWERQALTRARFVAGHAGLGEKFLNVAHAFCYSPKLEYGDLIEISRLRERMELEIAREVQKGRNVKLGYGGLADIEFAVQILQLTRGYRHKKLRATNTLDALNLLALNGIVEQDAAERLGANYLFLRNLECALRISSPAFANNLPCETDSLAALARLMGYPKATTQELAQTLLADYEKTTQAVRSFYRKTVGSLLRTAR